MDADQFEDGFGGDLLFQRGVIEARIERRTGGGLLQLLVIADRLGRSYELALAVAYRGGEVAALGIEADLHGLHLPGVRWRGRQRETHLLA